MLNRKWNNEAETWKEKKDISVCVRVSEANKLIVTSKKNDDQGKKRKKEEEKKLLVFFLMFLMF